MVWSFLIPEIVFWPFLRLRSKNIAENLPKIAFLTKISWLYRFQAMPDRMAWSNKLRLLANENEATYRLLMPSILIVRPFRSICYAQLRRQLSQSLFSFHTIICSIDSIFVWIFILSLSIIIICTGSHDIVFSRFHRYYVSMSSEIWMFPR